MSSSWLIGSNPECDLVVPLPKVSGRHCRLTSEDEGPGYLLEDLESTNGTYVNGVRIKEKVRVEVGDAITLGQLAPMPWPAGPATQVVVRIGRLPENDYVIKLPMVSGRHARIVWEKTGEAFLEDLESANGTALGNPDGKIQRSVLTSADTIYLGTHAILAAELFDRFAPRTALPENTPLPIASPFGAATPSEARQTGLAEDFAGTPNPAWRLVALLAQALVAGPAIVMLGTFKGKAVALFALSLAAVWFGLSNAVFGPRFVSSGTRDEQNAKTGTALVSRVSTLGLLCGVQCVLMWLVVAYGVGLKGAGGPTVGILFLASAVGLALGLLIVAAVPRPDFAQALLPLVMVLLWLCGNGPTPFPRTTLPTQAVASAFPSRWAFEGLLVIESGPSLKAGAKPRDTLAETYFPAASDRMGLKADGIALAGMWFGLTAAATFISGVSRPRV